MPQQPSAIKPVQFNQAGFTLIEVLVVLIIVAMISGVLFEALERAYRLQDRFGTELFKVQQGQMAADWYRQSVQGLHPDYSDGNHIFQGKEREFSGLSSNPLSDAFGAPTPITWKIRSNQQNGTTDLLYIEGNSEVLILSWRGNQAKFSYLDDNQSAHDSWPPPLGLSTQLPKQIQLIVKDGSDPLNIIASPMGPTTPLIRVQDAFGIVP